MNTPTLPHHHQTVFLTDGGLETTLIFHHGIDLPCFAAFHLLRHAEGVRQLRNYYQAYADLAQQFNFGMVLESVTWRANADWGNKLGYSRQSLADIQHQAIEEMRLIQKSLAVPNVISGCIGPRGDGYVPAAKMSIAQSEDYHGEQVTQLTKTRCDMISAFTLNYVEEAIGIVKAAKSLNQPVVISFTVETNGHLPTGQRLADAIAETDEATGDYPAYYMINCAHPTHFQTQVQSDPILAKRIRGLRANSSVKSHAELNESTELDAGDPSALAQACKNITQHIPIRVFGGCCGTDIRHVKAMAQAFSI